jgi:hypothetical protein
VKKATVGVVIYIVVLVVGFCFGLRWAFYSGIRRAIEKSPAAQEAIRQGVEDGLR